MLFSNSLNIFGWSKQFSKPIKTISVMIRLWNKVCIGDRADFRSVWANTNNPFQEHLDYLRWFKTNHCALHRIPFRWIKEEKMIKGYHYIARKYTYWDHCSQKSFKICKEFFCPFEISCHDGLKNILIRIDYKLCE